jgi:hypothetical protein
MKSSNITTLFSDQPRPSTGPSAVAVSLGVHIVAAAGLFLALKQMPRINAPEVTHLTVRLVRAQRIELAARRAGSSEEEKQPEPMWQALAHDSDSAPGSGASALSAPPQLPQLPQRSQTLVQPDAPAEQMLASETPVPMVVLWSPENTSSKILVAPPQQEPTVAETRPAMIKPNREPELSDLNITATHFPSQTPLLPASSTSPLVVRGQQVVKQMPSSSAVELETPTPARVLSLAPLQADGAVVVPFANQASRLSTAALETPSTGKSSGNGSPSATQAGNGAGTGAGPGSVKGEGASGSAGSGAQGGGGTVAGQSRIAAAAGHNGEDSRAGLLAGGEITVTRITTPKDGQFGVVVVGSTISEQYPEIVGLWTDRLVYTVYLHVGMRKNWILQYSLPRAEEAAAGGNPSRPEAPWPYDILRPKLNPADYNTDAIMVHGFVNPVGRFERLSLVLPTAFPEAKFVLSSLEQWRFRPAKQNGHDAAVEVLLIIPEEAE